MHYGDSCRSDNTPWPATKKKKKAECKSIEQLIRSSVLALISVKYLENELWVINIKRDKYQAIGNDKNVGLSKFLVISLPFAAFCSLSLKCVRSLV